MRDTAMATVALAAGALLVAPGRPRVALGVVGGGVLAALSIWALGGVVNALAGGAENGENRPLSRTFLLVKFFTRHGILAVAAYVMMVRLHLDPVGMLVGVTSAVVGAIAAARRK